MGMMQKFEERLILLLIEKGVKDENVEEVSLDD